MSPGWDTEHDGDPVDARCSAPTDLPRIALAALLVILGLAALAYVGAALA